MAGKGTETEAWIVDVHTHILPPRLALKIRAFFQAQIRQATAADGPGVEDESACCTGPVAPFRDQEEWSEDDFPNHGPFELQYHPHDGHELSREQRRNGVDVVWVLPYAHKSAIAPTLNAAIVDICTNLTRGSDGLLGDAVAAFTVHPDDGPQVVRETTIEALIGGGARAAKLHCSVGRYSILHDNLTPFWTIANQVHLPVVVHFGVHTSGNTASEDLADTTQLLSTYPHVRLIIAHSGEPAVQRAIKLAMRFDNVYLDTTPVVTRFPCYPPHTHPLHEPLMQMATSGRVLFGSDMPNVAMPLADQIQAVYHTFADEGWSAPTTESWWTSRDEARRAGKAVEQVLCGAATTLLAGVDVSALAAEQASTSCSRGSSSRM